MRIAPPLLLLMMVSASAVPGRAQTAATTPVQPAVDSACTYLRCAYNLAPRLHSIAIVRGSDEERVGSLGFFWPDDVRRHFVEVPGLAGDSARRHASAAVRTRRAGALLTDLGILLLGAASLQLAREGGLDGMGRGLAITGVSLLGASYPVQLRADHALSRAVWWHNASLTEPSSFTPATRP
jgi:hypothetical protein